MPPTGPAAAPAPVATAPAPTLFEHLPWVPGRKAQSLTRTLEPSESAGRATLAHYKRLGGYRQQLVGYTAAGVAQVVVSC